MKFTLKIRIEAGKAANIAGRTNITPCTKIILTMPTYVIPIIRITPISNVFVSTFISNRE